MKFRVIVSEKKSQAYLSPEAAWFAGAAIGECHEYPVTQHDGVNTVFLCARLGERTRALVTVAEVVMWLVKGGRDAIGTRIDTYPVVRVRRVDGSEIDGCAMAADAS